MSAAVALGARSSTSANAPANGRAPVSKRKVRRQSLHIKDTAVFPSLKEALTAEAAAKQFEQEARQEAKKAQQLRRVAEDEAGEQAEAERKAAEEKVAAERRVEEEKARLVIEALEVADAERARLETETVARLEAKKKAKADALERKARRLSAAQWAEPSKELAVWPVEFNPMPSQPEEKADEPAACSTPQPQQQRYAGRLTRARSSNRQTMLSRVRSVSSSSVSSEDTPTPVIEKAAPVIVEAVPTPVEEAAPAEEAAPVEEDAPAAMEDTPTPEIEDSLSPVPVVSAHAEPLATIDAPAPPSVSKPKKGSAKDLIARFNTH